MVIVLVLVVGLVDNLLLLLNQRTAKCNKNSLKNFTNSQLPTKSDKILLLSFAHSYTHTYSHRRAHTLTHIQTHRHVSGCLPGAPKIDCKHATTTTTTAKRNNHKN